MDILPQVPFEGLTAHIVLLMQCPLSGFLSFFDFPDDKTACTKHSASVAIFCLRSFFQKSVPSPLMTSCTMHTSSMTIITDKHIGTQH